MSEHRRAHIHAPTNLLDKATDKLTAFSGSWAFISLHVVWFALWFVFRLDINTLTLIVSLEAIFLATFVLMSQNRAAQKDHVRDDLEANEISEIFNTHQELLQLNRTQLEILNLLHELSSKPTPPRRVTR